MGNYDEYARREFKALGYKPIEEEEEGPNKWVQENVLELLEVFSKQGHSGSSAPYVAKMFEKLALFEPLSPITGKEQEWAEPFMADGTQQNVRCCSLFRTPGELPRYSDAIVWKGPDPYDTFTGGNMNGISSSLCIKGFPFTPKTFYIDVKREKYDPEIHGENARVTSCGDGDYVYSIKDHEQLLPVWEIYHDPRSKS